MDQKRNTSLAGLEDSLLTSSQDPTSSWGSSTSAENEFLRIQAIQNQSEVETLHKKLDSCLKEKEKLQRFLFFIFYLFQNLFPSQVIEAPESCLISLS
ncbi:hypothetical protein MKX01_018200 [Papaver californicum]|nr:hypothetical protein MKX01_018200 [Papaver californicum]